MKIGIYARTWDEMGGIGVYTRNLLRTMLSLETDHHFLLFYRKPAHVGQFRNYHNVKEIFLSAQSKFLWDQLAVPRIAHKENVDILFHPKMAVPLLARCKTVMVMHGSERFVYPEFSYKSDILYTKAIYPFYIRHAKGIISVSDNARKDIIRLFGISPEKIRTVHLASSGDFRRVDDQLFLASIRRKYSLPKRFILNVGLIYPGKNIPNLLRAFALARQKEDIRLVLVGTGRRMYKKDLSIIQALRLQGEVLLPGYIPHQDLVGVYNLAHALVFPSFYESFPAPPLEANACGCPVVTSSTGGTPESAGNGAIYVDPRDPEDIADAIVRVLSDEGLRKDLIQRGFQNVIRFSWEKTAQETLAALESVAQC